MSLALASRPSLSAKHIAALLPFGGRTPLEAELAAYFSVPGCVGFSSARAALYHILVANGLQGKRILVTGYTCAAVAEAIVNSGNTPVFADTTAGSWNADLSACLEQPGEGEELAAVIVTDLYGLPAPIPDRSRNPKLLYVLDLALGPDPERVRSSLDSFDFVMVSGNFRKPFSSWGGGYALAMSDAAHDLLTRHAQKAIGKAGAFERFKAWILAAAVCASFLPISYRLIRFIRQHTAVLDGFFKEELLVPEERRAAYAYGLMPFQTRIGSLNLKAMAETLSKRKHIAQRYARELAPQLLTHSSSQLPISHFTILVSEPDRVATALWDAGVDTERYFSYSCAELPAYGGPQSGACENACFLARHALNLPLHPGLDDDTVTRIIRTVNALVAAPAKTPVSICAR